MPRPLNFHHLDQAALEETARALAVAAEAGDAICLSGPLGAGKTTFAKAYLHALGVEDDVVSPTFNLVLTYAGSAMEIWHVDLYRLEEPEELLELGLEDGFEYAVMVIEWPDRLGSKLPENRVDITFAVEPDTAGEEPRRALTIQFHGTLTSRYARIPRPSATHDS